MRKIVEEADKQLKLRKGDTMNIASTKDKVIRLVLFCLLFFILLFGTCHVLEDKYSKKQMYALRYEPKDTIDIVFLGNSHVNNGIAPVELWNKYGYTTYNFSMMSQTFPLVYYNAVDAIKLQHPDILIVDLFAATSFSNNFPNMHKTIDNLTFKTRMTAIQEVVPDELKTEYTYPLYIYHDRWNRLEKKDVLPYFLRYAPRRNYNKGSYLPPQWNYCENPYKDIANAGVGDLTEEHLYWYERLDKLCEDNGVQLVFTVIPYTNPIGGTVGATVKNMEIYNATEVWCKDNDVGYVNLFYHLDDMDFDFSTDMSDESHVNILGALKVTDFLGKYISQNYNVADNRSNARIAKEWNESYEKYSAERDVLITKCKEAQK